MAGNTIFRRWLIEKHCPSGYDTRKFVTLRAADILMWGKFCFGMVESRELFPRIGAVAVRIRPVNHRREPAACVLPFVGIGVTTGAIQTLPVTDHGGFRLELGGSEAVCTAIAWASLGCALGFSKSERHDLLVRVGIIMPSKVEQAFSTGPR